MANKKEDSSPLREIDLKVKLLPRSSQNKIVGWEGEFIKIKVTASPVQGQANKALIEFLSKKLKKPKSHIYLLFGESSRLKTVRIKDCTHHEIENLLSL